MHDNLIREMEEWAEHLGMQVTFYPTYFILHPINVNPQEINAEIAARL